MKRNAQDMTEGRILKTREWVVAAEVSTLLVVGVISIPILSRVAFPAEDLEAAFLVAMNFIFDWISSTPNIFVGESYILDFLKGPQL